MMKDVVSVEPKDGYRLKLRFEDGAEGIADVSMLVKFTGVMKKLSDREYFSRVKVDAEIGTIVWPDGQDIDPEVLYSAVTGNRIPGTKSGAFKG